MFQLKSLSELLRNKVLNNDNLHRIAISNLRDHERQVARWWCKKYRTPLKLFAEHTMEELIVEMLEDYYDNHPAEIERFLSSEENIPDWDGSMSPEYEAEIQARLRKINERNRVDISKYQTTDENLTDEQCESILNNLGRNLPKSRAVTKRDDGSMTIGSDEFEDKF